MFYEPLKGATATVFRRHKTSGRIIPCQISQDDPALRDSSLRSLPWEQVLRRIIPPRFDTVLTPTIMDVLNQDQMICMALGVLRVLQLQLMNPVLFGWSPAAKAEGPSAAVLRALARRGAVATADAAQLAAKLASEVSSLPVNRFLRFLEAARRLSLMRGIPPQVKAEAIEALAERLGLEVGGRTIMQGGRILVVAKDARTALQIASDGSITFGRAKMVGTTIEIIDPLPIRALKP